MKFLELYKTQSSSISNYLKSNLFFGFSQVLHHRSDLALFVYLFFNDKGSMTKINKFIFENLI